MSTLTDGQKTGVAIAGVSLLAIVLTAAAAALSFYINKYILFPIAGIETTDMQNIKFVLAGIGLTLLVKAIAAILVRLIK